MRRVFFFFLLLPLFLLASKKAYIVVGPECSGSVFISQVIAYVVGKDKVYKQHSAEFMNGEVGDDIVVLHCSLPTFNNHVFYDRAYFKKKFVGYDVYYILTTRDHNISATSKIRRFKESRGEVFKHEKRAREIMGEILINERAFVWSYETMVLLKESYFQKLYDFLDVDSNFFPLDLKDANSKYFKNRIGE